MTETPVHDLVGRLTLLQKAALVTGKNNWESRDYPGLGLRSLWVSDGPSGLRKQVGDADHLGLNPSQPATCFPSASATANSWDPALLEAVGQAIGAEARAQDVDVVLGPGLNLKRSPLGGRCFEYFSEDPYLSGKLAAGFVRGVQSQGVAACPKHFAANSQELRRMASDSVIDERTLRELYLTGFEITVREAKPRVVMSSYNLVNGTYASENRHLLTEILRDEWGFAGAVVTDWGGSNDIVEAVRAGSTFEMPAAGLDSARQLVAAVEEGRLSVADLDARVKEALTLVAEAAQPGSGPAVDPAAHHALARLAAARSCVLLKNEGSLLPLAPGSTVAVIGDFAQTPRYQGAGSSVVNATQLDTLLEALPAAGLVLAGYAEGFRRDGAADPALVAAAVELARTAETVIVTLGLPETAESEGVDRATLALPANQLDLLTAVAAANPRVVVTLSAGAVVECGWVSHAQAVVHGCLGGQAGASGLLDVLTGVVNPSGRLAETIPLSLADTPTAGRFPSPGPTAEYREGPFVGYRYYTSAGVPVAFPFGFGLSYTTFALGALKATATQVTAEVTNTGQVPGAAVVQVYVRRVTPGILRPDRELKGFARVELEPGETTTVTVPLDASAFRFFDVRTGTWERETGDYEILVGSNAADLVSAGTVHVDGTVPALAPDPNLAALNAVAVHDVTDAEFDHLLGHPIPPTDEGRILTATDPLGRLTAAPSALGRLVGRFLHRQVEKGEQAGKPNLDALFQVNMPFRAIPKMMGGMVDRSMVDGILHLVNGHFFTGLGRTVKAFFANRKANQATRAELGV
jgi:beta-glucosidase